VSPRYVDPEPFDPAAVDPGAADPARERFATASQWQLLWWRFRRHRIAIVSLWFLAALYASLFVTEFLAPYHKDTRDPKHILAPPQTLHLFHEGHFVGPFVYGYRMTLDMTTLKRVYEEDRSRPQPLRFFCRGDPYRFWNLFEADLHLVCPAEGGTFFLLGTDRLGRDLFSRILYGARVSLTVGLFGIAVSFVFGLLLGGLSGYYGGWVDVLVQRAIEVIRSFPTIPLWLSLSAAMPVWWDPLWVYFGITIILGLIDWTGLARAVRSKVLALREEDFAQAARLVGAGPGRIIFRHLIPSFASHLIASATLSIPSMILGETALSFLGLGVRAPMTSWGVLLNDAQNIDVVALHPWLMLPVVPVILVVLAFNFLGDGLRDAADPYARGSARRCGRRANVRSRAGLPPGTLRRLVWGRGSGESAGSPRGPEERRCSICHSLRFSPGSRRPSAVAGPNSTPSMPPSATVITAPTSRTSARCSARAPARSRRSRSAGDSGPSPRSSPKTWAAPEAACTPPSCAAWRRWRATAVPTGSARSRCCGRVASRSSARAGSGAAPRHCST